MEATKQRENSAPVGRIPECSDEYFRSLYENQDKWSGRLRLEKAIEERRLEVDAGPWTVYLEPTPRCNLHCCDWAENQERKLRPDLTPGRAETFLSELWSSLILVKLFYWGEPFINADLPEIIARIHERDVGTFVQSNLQSMTPEMAERTIRSGLDVLVATMDGATQRTYGSFRKGGDLATAISNLGTFMRIRRRLSSKTPRVIWQFTAHRTNDYEVQNAQRQAKGLGLDGFVVVPSPIEAPAWKPDPRVVPFDRSTPALCHQTWSEPVILSDGRLMPSNNASFGKYPVGHVTDGFFRAFNSESFRQARQACLDRPFAQAISLGPCNR